MSFWNSIKNMINSIIDTDPELRQYVKRKSGNQEEDWAEDLIGSFGSKKDKPTQTPVKLSKRETDNMNDIFFGDDN